MTRKFVSLATLATLLVLAVGGHALAADARTITITGEGTAAAKPDMAVLTAGVASQAATAAEALAANSEATRSVIDRFKSESIEARDIQTTGFSLQPVLVYPKADDATSLPPRITGYTVSNTVSVRIRDLSRLGDVMDKVVSAGANSISGIDFVVSRQSELLDNARREAVADARRKAELYAAAAGVRLGAIMTLTEQSGSVPPRPMYRMNAAAAGAVPVEAGESELRVEVSATFALE